MSRTRRGVLSLLLAAGLLLVSWGVGTAAPSPSVVRAHGTDAITITVSSVFRFSPDNFEVAPGDTVTLTLEQLDGAEHTFALSSVTNYSLVSTNSSTDVNNFFQAHPPLAYAHFNLTAGVKQTRTFLAPRLGVYEYLCTIGGHFQAGMYGKMGSGVAVGPSNPSQVPTGLYLIAGGIVALVVLAIVLGFVIGRREGAKHEMPPERLGYAEPTAPSPSPEPPRPPAGA